ncbi:hypothetical protein F2Q70_00036086 [Brassica cretica]|uniref:DUF223 domain-containing protein n=1 Tax=Brassica cretica TaxID=69181 RepID=A0A8S9JQ82_BRACR|nr:hypothetical protein F2Q68_00031286 [Brassica cretica]KAF2583656.1 hypothetical protein F2Q70_00036086 [Brassica cretica]
MFLSASPVPQTGVPASVTQPSRSLWESQFSFLMKIFCDSWVTPVGGANHYMTSLKEDSIVKVDRFTVARCSSMYKITDHPFLIRFISLTIIDEVITDAPEINLQSRLDHVVGKIHYVQGSDLTKEITRVVIVSSLI